jgi:hypothetical protein
MTIYSLPNDSTVAVHDIYDDLPDFMQQADCLFIDIPYDQSLLTNFKNRPESVVSDRNDGKFGSFLDRLFECIDQISPATLFLETGKQALAECIKRAEARYRYVTFYNSTYYRKRENKCYVIHATNEHQRRRYRELEDLDEAEIIEWICANHEYQCIGDLCMGQGLVGKHAFLNGRKFVGTELNKKRLAVLVDFVQQNS